MKKFADFLDEQKNISESQEWLTEEDFQDEFDNEINELNEKRIVDMTPEQHKNLRYAEAEATEWHKSHPVNHDNIIHHYNQATADEKFHGHNWYQDAHHISKLIAKDTKTPMHTMAGLVSNYSPQTHWNTNIMTAAQVAKHKKAVGGPGSGVFADTRQKNAAKRMLKGEHYDSVLKGHKTKAFAHLIEHGGNKDPKNPRVVIDRHAYSVAAGGRMTDAAFGQVKLKSKKGYQHVADAYHRAAQHISEAEGRTVHPHQVQATTWLVRQRLNAEEEHAAKGTSVTRKNAESSKQKWDAYARKHHPKVMGKEPGTGWTGVSSK